MWAEDVEDEKRDDRKEGGSVSNTSCTHVFAHGETLRFKKPGWEMPEDAWRCFEAGKKS